MDDIGTYGQFGQAVYDHDERDWQFGRSTNTIRAFQPLGESKIVAGPSDSERIGTVPADGKEGPSRRRENQVKALIKFHPEIQPASGLLPDLARVSEAVDESSSRHDSAKGSLLAFGVVTDELAKRQVEVVAFPTGPSGSDLRIVQIQKQRRGWHQNRSAYLVVPTIYGEEATWQGPGVPIQHIIFVKPLEGVESFLAVRLITQTLMFRPVLRKTQVPGSKSRLDVNLIQILCVDQTGGAPYADVVFNPWYSRQLALLDQNGQFAVWEVERSRGNHVKRLCARRSLKEQRSINKTSSHDFWGRAVWISGPSVLAVCDRYKLKLFDITGRNSTELDELDVGLSDAGWMLDLVLVPSKPSYIAIFTSQHIVIYHVDLVRDGEVVPTKTAQVRHFRNADDISLRASCFSDSDDVLLSLGSDLDPTVLIYRLHFTTGNGVIIFDAIELDMTFSDKSLGGIRLSTLHVSPVAVYGELNEISDGLKLGKDAHFYQLTTLHRDLSVRQTLHVLTAAGHVFSKLGGPTWERDLTKSVHIVMDDDVIVCDDDEQLQTVNERREPVPSFVQRLREQQALHAGNWKVNYELTARHLNEVDVADVTDMDEVIETVQTTLQKQYMDTLVPFRAVKELAENEITVQDIDTASADLQGLLRDGAISKTGAIAQDGLEEHDQTPRLTLRSVTPLTFNIPSSRTSDHLREVYDSIAGTWIRPESNGISDLVQHSKDQIARRVAAEVAFASLVIRTLESQTELDPQSQSQTQSQSQPWELPVRTGATPSRETPSVYFEASSQPRSPRLPTPSESSASATTTSNPAIARLSQYTIFTGKSTPAPLSKRLNRVLSHWTVGSDPKIYDWLSASRHLTRRAEQEEAEVEGSEMTEKERLRLERRKERYVRRQRREAEEAQRMQLLSSQAPEIGRGSQLVRAGSQQAAADSQSQSQGQVVASQVLPGRHGGRPAKKKRKSGF